MVLSLHSLQSQIVAPEGDFHEAELLSGANKRQ